MKNLIMKMVSSILTVFFVFSSSNAVASPSFCSNPVVTRLTNDEFNQSFQVVYDDLVVWEDARNVASGNAIDIYMYSLTSQQVIPVATTPNMHDLNPRIDKNWIVYKRKMITPDPKNWVYLYNISTGETSEIGSEATGVISLKIKDDLVAYSANNRIVLYRISDGTRTEIATDSASETGVFLSNKYLAYTKYVTSTNSDVYLYDLQTGTERVVAGGSSAEGATDIFAGTKLTYQIGFGPDEYHIFLYDIETEVTTQVTNNHEVENQFARLNRNNLVWLDRDILGYRHVWTVSTQNPLESPQLLAQSDDSVILVYDSLDFQGNVIVLSGVFKGEADHEIFAIDCSRFQSTPQQASQKQEAMGAIIHP